MERERGREREGGRERAREGERESEGKREGGGEHARVQQVVGRFSSASRGALDF